MFDFLQKLSHHHAKKQKEQNINNQAKLNQYDEFDSIQQTKIKQKSRQAKNKNQQKQEQQAAEKVNKAPRHQISLSAQLQSGQAAELNAQVLQILERMRDQSEKRLKQTQLQLVLEGRNKIQRKVYLREMSHNNQEYLQEILIQSSSPNQKIRQSLATVVDTVVGAIYSDIMYTNKYQIQKKASINKDQLILLQKSLKQIKNNEGNIRDKVGELKLQLKNESQNIHEHSLQIISKQSYSAHHPKTKQVQNFLKSIQMQRMQQRMRYQQSLQQQKIRKSRQSQMLQAARQKAKSQRHQRLVESYQIKRKIKQQEVEMTQKRQKQFQQWVKQYKNKVPLFKEKQRQFYQNFVLKQNQQRYNKMLRRKENYEPMEFEQIQQHQQRYMDQKRDNLARHKLQAKMKKQAQKRRQQKLDNLHKGQFRYFVLEEMVAKKQAKDPKQQLIQKKLRQMAYSQNVKQQHKPKIDQIKQLQMQRLLNSSKKRQKYSNPRRAQSIDALTHHKSYSYDQQQEKDFKKQGQRNRRYLKQFLLQKIQKGEIKKKQQERASTIEPKTNYLHQLRNQRASTAIKKAQTIDHQIQSVKRKQDLGGLLAMVDHHDSKAQRLQQKFKYAAHKPEQQAALQDNYLFSIKAKLQLLKNYD